MRKTQSILFLTFVFVVFFSGSGVLKAQILEVARNASRSEPSSTIKSIQTLGEKTGIAYTDDRVFKTSDNGDSWRTLILPKDFSQTIGAVEFLDGNVGWAILIDSRRGALTLAKTGDGGDSWTFEPVDLPDADLNEAEFENVSLEFIDSARALLTLPLASGSNFSRRAVYATTDGAETWRVEARLTNKKEKDAESAFDKTSLRAALPKDESVLASESRKNSAWLLAAAGECVNFKSDCLQTTKIYDVSANRLRDITPFEIKESNRAERENIKIRTTNPLLLLPPPGGSTRISRNRGFDKCTAAPVEQMQTWWNASPFYDTNIYMSGRNRGCSQALLNAAWVNRVSGMGWGLIPTVVGYQAPCSVCTNCQKHSSDPAVAETQGRGEADIAVNDATNLGLARGTVLYYDMERYDETANTPGCRLATNSFLKGWTDRLKEQDYISGVYGSPFNAAADWINIPEASRMDVVWLARWNNVASVWGVAPLADNYWTNHQRIHQYMGGHDETWGGIKFNIDSDIEDAPVAGASLPKIRWMDFDGDGKADVSVYRPSNGVWYLQNSTSGFSSVQFGIASDKIVPADYDGDGKTDVAVWREGVWYLQRSAAGFASIQFGSASDVPVPADFDGDGKSELVVYRPSTGNWFTLNLANGAFTAAQFGGAEDKPVAADYDGDGRADYAVFRPSSGSWYIQKSKGEFTAVQFGISTDKPVPGDYDGDGRIDQAVYRPENGTWYINQSTRDFTAAQFGVSTDLPAPGDYDGDGKTDIAVFRPTSGTFYQQRSALGFGAAQFGAAGDRPTPNAFVP